MRRAGCVLVLGLVCAAPLAAAQGPPRISQASIAGIRLGMTQAQARSLLKKPVRLDRLEDGYVRLVSPREKVEAYFRTGTKGVAVVTTWNRQLKTDEQVGPCSTVAALKRAYGSRLVPFRLAGRVAAYRIRNLLFTAESVASVGVVALSRFNGATVYIAFNATQCS